MCYNSTIMTQQTEEVYKVGPGHPPKEYQFKPGQIGNPAGRPKSAVSHLLKNDEKFSNKAVAQKLYDLALSGDMGAIREYLDRTEGKVMDKHLTLALTANVTPELLEQAKQRFLTAGEEELKLLE